MKEIGTFAKKQFTWANQIRNPKEYLGEEVDPSTLEGYDYWSSLPVGFYKVDEYGGSYSHCICFNPQTKEWFSVLQWDYDDFRVDGNIFRHTSIDYDGEAFQLYWDLVYKSSFMKEEEEKREYEEWEKSLPHVGDTVIVVKGRTLPKGTVGKVVKEFTYQASYNNIITYLVLEDGNKINRANTRKVN